MAILRKTARANIVQAEILVMMGEIAQIYTENPEWCSHSTFEQRGAQGRYEKIGESLWGMVDRG